ncbi:MAG: tetratricopeptide repeat protein [Bacteroidota bacterium]
MFNKTSFSVISSFSSRLGVLLSVLVLFNCVPRSDHPFLEEDQTNPQEVLEYLNDVLRVDPDNNNALYQKAQIQIKQKDWEAALLTIDKALKIDFTNNDYFFLRGKITAQLGKYDESVRSFNQAETLGNKSHELYKLLSRSYLALDQPSESREVVNRLLKLDDGDEAHILAGETLLALNDSAAAFSQFNTAININKTNEKALYGIKQIHLGRGELIKAETILDELMASDPSRASFILEKVDLLKNRESMDTAKMLIKIVFQRDSSDQIITELARLEYLSGNYDSTLFYLEKLKNKNNTSVLLLNARALDKNRDYVKSRAVYESILLQDSTNNIAQSELTALKGKMAYLQRTARKRTTLDSIRNSPPPVLNRRELVN